MLVVVLGVALAVSASAQQQPSASAEQQAAMDAWMKAASPGAPHQRLAQFEGSWNVTTKMWMAPGATPEVSAGTATSKMVLGGRYLRERVESVMMGMPFEGIGYTGYDNLKGKYVGTWVDNFGTGVLTVEGTWNEADNSLVTTAEMLDPMTGKMTSMRMVTRVVDANTHVAEFYQPGPDGVEFKGMELTYTRAPGGEKAKADKTKKNRGK